MMANHNVINYSYTFEIAKINNIPRPFIYLFAKINIYDIIYMYTCISFINLEYNENIR